MKTKSYFILFLIICFSILCTSCNKNTPPTEMPDDFNFVITFNYAFSVDTHTNTIGCKCGEVLWNGLTPNDIQLYVFTDKQMDKILENDTIETIDVFELNNYEVWLCPKYAQMGLVYGLNSA